MPRKYTTQGKHALASNKKRKTPTIEYIVVAIIFTLLGMLAVAAVKPQYVDRPYAVVTTTTTTVTKTYTPTPTPTKKVQK